MKTNIRQGIIRAQRPAGPSASGPPFLSYVDGTGRVDLLATPATPVIVTAAHYTANYLIEEIRNVIGAWGGGNGPGAPASFNPADEVTRGENNDVVDLTSTKKHLFWDINLSTGVMRRGWTPLLPLKGIHPPPAPQHGQHWFDTSEKVMKMWVKPTPSSAGRWQDKVRVFAAVWDPAAPETTNIDFSKYPIGQTQANFAVGSYAAGNIIFGVNGRPLKAGHVLVTTEDELIIAQTSGQNVKFDAALVFAIAEDAISPFSCVSFTSDRKIRQASCLDTASFVSGIVIEPLNENEAGQVITNGVVRNEQWATNPLADGGYLVDNANAPLFITTTGLLTFTPPTLGSVQQVGFVYDETAIYFNLFPPVILSS